MRFSSLNEAAMTSRLCGKSGGMVRCLIVGIIAMVEQSAIGRAITPSLSCPDSIQERSLQLVDLPEGWVSFIGSPLYLHGAAPMSGPPEQLGELSDYKQRREKNGWVYTYGLDGKFPDGKWLVCTYGESDQVKLSRRLDDDVRACTFTYRKGKYVGQHEIMISCTN
ncbi:STY0301 family protein [Duganella sp. 1224]|uniref:STY0301 family protein n=1 Tax=Duganella sp. 1224 TaxID=2587052 RepID=UPI0035A5BB08